MSIFQKKILRSNNHGFLLLEVLVSILVISIGIVFVFRSFSTSIKAFKVSREYFKATLFMEEAMWPYNDKGITAGSFDGTFPQDDLYKWTVVSTIPDPETASTYKIYKVIPKISWKSGDSEGNLAYATFLKEKTEP